MLRYPVSLDKGIFLKLYHLWQRKKSWPMRDCISLLIQNIYVTNWNVWWYYVLYKCYIVETLRPQQNGWYFTDYICKCIFYKSKQTFFVFLLKFCWSLFLWFSWHYAIFQKQGWPFLLTHIWVTIYYVISLCISWMAEQNDYILCHIDGLRLSCTNTST